MKNTTLTPKSQKIVQLKLVDSNKREALSQVEKMSADNSLKNIDSKQATKETSPGLDAFIILRINEIDILEETFGRIISKELVGIVNTRLGRCLKEKDAIERISSNEFAIMVTDLDSKAYIEKLVQRIEKCCNGEYVCFDLKLHLSMAVGVSFSPQFSTLYEEQLRYARIALRKAIRQPNDPVQFYSPEMLDDLQEQAGMIFEIRQALKQDRFVLHYQPQYEVDTQETVAVEALIRLQGQNGELIYPDHFIDLAEETGLILPIGHWVIQEACQQYRRWQDQGCAPQHIAVNVSSKQLADNSLIEIVDSAVKNAGIEYSNLEVEITEQQLIQHITMAEGVLKELSNKGVRIALDDFGTGYSSMAYLAQLPLNVLKIDRSFLQQLDKNTRTAGLIKSIIYLAKELDLKVVAEGVETSTQHDFIHSVGCDLGQGYGYARPQNVELITSLLQPQDKQACNAVKV